MAYHHDNHGMPAQKKPWSLWWPMSMLIGWIFFIALGAGLIGGFAAQYRSCLRDAASSDYLSSSSFDSTDNCTSSSASPMWIGGVVCIIIGALFHLLFWILLIVWLVKRSNYRRAQTVYVQQAPAVPAPGYDNNYAVAGYASQHQQQPYYNQQQPNYYNKA